MVCTENSHFGRIRRSAVDYVNLRRPYLARRTLPALVALRHYSTCGYTAGMDGSARLCDLEKIMGALSVAWVKSRCIRDLFRSDLSRQQLRATKF
jgi:hypothetical protein